MQRISVGGSDGSWSTGCSNNFLGKVGTFQNILEVLVEKKKQYSFKKLSEVICLSFISLSQ